MNDPRIDRLKIQISVESRRAAMYKKELSKKVATNNRMNTNFLQNKIAANSENLRSLYLAKGFLEGKCYSEVEPNTRNPLPSHIKFRATKFVSGGFADRCNFVEWTAKNKS